MLELNLIIAAADTLQAYCGVMLCVGSSPRSDMTFGLPATALSALTSTILREYAIAADVQHKK